MRRASGGGEGIGGIFWGEERASGEHISGEGEGIREYRTIVNDWGKGEK